MTYYSTFSVKVHHNDNNTNDDNNHQSRKIRRGQQLICVLTDCCRKHPLRHSLNMHDPSVSIVSKPKRFAGSYLVNRHNVKFLIRVLVGIALAHFIGQRFRPTHAAPSSTKSNWKNRPPKILPSTTPSDGKFTQSTVKFSLPENYNKENRISFFYLTTRC